MGRCHVNKFSAIDNALQQDLLKWDRVTATGIEYSSQPAKLHIATIDARAPYARLIIATDQTLNITQLFTPAAGAHAARGADRARHRRRAPRAGGNPAAMRLSIGNIKVLNGSANFADFWITA